MYHPKRALKYFTGSILPPTMNYVQHKLQGTKHHTINFTELKLRIQNWKIMFTKCKAKDYRSVDHVSHYRQKAPFSAKHKQSIPLMCYTQTLK